MAYTPQLLPTPRQSPGLIDAYTDIIGGDFTQANVSGSQSSLNFNGLAAQFSVTAGGPTGKQVIIPASWYGGNVTWVRGLYALSAVPRYPNFMSEIYSGLYGSGDTTNYADFTQVATNNYSGGVLSTSIPVLASVAVGTTLQAYYSYRTTAETIKGQSISTYPMIHVDAYQSTKNDGDNYMMSSLYHAYDCTGDQKYKALADKIGNALFDAGIKNGEIINFNIPFSSENGEFGMYWYTQGTSTLSVSVSNFELDVVASISSIYPAAIGLWPAVPITSSSPMKSFDLGITGDGSSKNISLEITASLSAGGSQIFYVNVPMFSSYANVPMNMSFSPSDFWYTKDVLYDAKHTAPTGYAFGTNTYSLFTQEDVSNGYIIQGLSWDFSGNVSGNAGITIGTNYLDSAGTTGLNFDIWVSSTGNYIVRAYDSALTPHDVTLTFQSGWNYGISIPWTTFDPAFSHPFREVSFQVNYPITSGTLFVNKLYYGTLTKLSDVAFNAIENILFQFLTSGSYSVKFSSWYVNKNQIDGPSVDPVRYSAITREEYKWAVNGNSYSYGTWRGPSNCGYMWLSGWQRSGIYNPTSNRLIASEMLDFLMDAQNAYTAQYPNQVKGPFMNLYGRTSWESISTNGYTVGTSPVVFAIAPLSGAVISADSYNGASYTIGTGDGVTTSFNLPTGFDLEFLYKTDWQGKQLQYSTPRTNLATNGSAPGTGTNSTTALSTVITSPGGSPVYVGTYGAGATDTNISYYAVPVTSGQYVKASWWVYIPGTWASGQVTLEFEATGQGGFDQQLLNMALLDQWQKVILPPALIQAGVSAAAIVLRGANITVGDFLYTTACQFEAGDSSPVGGYIPTVSASVTVTDYSINTTPTYGSTLNKFYWSGTSDWYGYYYRAALSVAQYYFLSQSATAKSILDSWMTWINLKVIASGGYWQVPDGFNNDGTITYGGYGACGPVYGHALLAQVCMYKYFVDGDAIALTWYRRFLDTIYGYFRITTTGQLSGIYPVAEGSGYTTATINFTVNVGATAPTATAYIAGGKITHYVVTSAGSGITSISMTVTGDGTGAVGNPYLSDQLVGAFSNEHTGWEAAEIFNTYGLLVNGPPPGGKINHTLTSTANDITAFTGLYQFYVNNTSDTRPSMRTSALMPLHEFDVGSWHWNAGIENPMVKDTHVKGAMWTETIAPSLKMAVEYYRYAGDTTWLDALYNLLLEFTGGSAPSTGNYFVPNSVSGESQVWEGPIGFMAKRRK